MNLTKFPQKQTTYEEFTKELETGDLLLYKTYGIVPEILAYFEPCKYTHVSIILKRPTWLDKSLTEDYYILESIIDDAKGAITHSSVKDIKVISLHYVYNNYTINQLGHLYTRKLHAYIPVHQIHEKIKEAHDIIKNDTYDTNINDWITAFVTMDDKASSFDFIHKYHNKHVMWCSALVAYVYKKCGFVSQDIPWSIINPCDFGAFSNSQHLRFDNCKLDNEILRL